MKYKQAMNRCVFFLSIFTVLNGWSDNGNFVMWQGENPKETNFREYRDFQPVTFENNKHRLIENNWLTHFDETPTKERVEGTFATYTVQVPQDGLYNFWCRKFFSHGPFKWRFDKQLWRLSTKNKYHDSMILKPLLCANWFQLDQVKLRKGTHVFELNLTYEPHKKEVAACFDAFVLIRGEYVPKANTPIDANKITPDFSASPKCLVNEKGLTLQILGAAPGDTFHCEYSFDGQKTTMVVRCDNYAGLLDIPYTDEGDCDYAIQVRKGESSTPVFKTRGFVVKRHEEGSPYTLDQMLTDYTGRFERLKDKQPATISKEDWQRNLAVLQYELMLLSLHQQDDELSATTITKRKASQNNLLPRLSQVVRTMERGENFLTEQKTARREAYISQVDGSAQPYTVLLPPAYKGKKVWPLVVYLHGSGWWCEEPQEKEAQEDCILVRVDGRGVDSGYNNLAESDVLRVVSEVRQHYNIDADRIYLWGHSMGGHGTWHMASRYPDLFAAVMPSAGRPSGPVENLLNLPVLAVHDKGDFVVPSDFARWAVGYLKQLDYSASLLETTDYGHEMWTPFITRKFDRIGEMLGHTRKQAPMQISFETIRPSHGKAYWIRILDFERPSQKASVKANVVEKNSLHLTTKNVKNMALSLTDKLFDKEKPLQVLISGKHLTLPSPLPLVAYLQVQNNEFTLATEESKVTALYRKYERGSLANLYRGEPLLIVVGSDNDNLQSNMDALAKTLAHSSGSHGTMQFETIPVKLDTDVSLTDIETKNLVLIGGPHQNAVSKKIFEKLSISETEKQVRLTKGLIYDLTNRGYTFYHYNPLAPKRQIFVISSDQSGFYHIKNGAIDRALDNETPLDFILMDIEPQRVVRQISWNAEWKPEKEFFDKKTLPAAFGDWHMLTEKKMKLIHKKTGADYVIHPDLYEYSNTTVFDVNHAAWADFYAGIKEDAILTAEISGALLKDIIRSHQNEFVLLYYPRLVKDRVDETRTYRIAFLNRTIYSLLKPLRKNIGTVSHFSREWIEDLHE